MSLVIMQEMNAHVVYRHRLVSLCTYTKDFGNQMFIDGEDRDLQ